MFENFILSELIKSRFHKGLRNNCYFWRDHKGSEIDCIIDKGQHLIPIEIKTSRTFFMSLFPHLSYWNKISNDSSIDSFVVYGGDKNIDTKDGKLVGWQNLHEITGII